MCFPIFSFGLIGCIFSFLFSAGAESRRELLPFTVVVFAAVGIC